MPNDFMEVLSMSFKNVLFKLEALYMHVYQKPQLVVLYKYLVDIFLSKIDFNIKIFPENNC